MRARRPLVAGAATLVVAQVAVVVLRPRTRLPPAQPGLARPIDPGSYFTPDQLDRARRFRRPQAALGLATLAVEGGLLLALARGRGWAPWRRAGEPEARSSAADGLSDAVPDGPPSSAAPTPTPWLERHPLLAGAAAGATVTVAIGLAPLPLAALGRRRALRAGLATGSWGLWAADVGRSTALSAAGGGLLGGGTAALVRRWPRRWWLPGAGLGLGASAALTFVAPILIEPLFGRTTPLQDPRLVADVQELARRAGVRVEKVLVSDASRRTTAVNAHVSGVGRSRRVVFWDTLLQQFSGREARVVVAHELSHVVHRDIPRGLALLAIVIGPATHATAVLAEALTRPGAGHPDGRGGALPVSVPAVFLASSLVGTLLASASGQLSRAIERRADDDALRWSRDPAAMVEFQQKIVVSNLGDPDPRGPARLMQLLLGTHPTTIDRIAAAVRFATEAGIPLPSPRPPVLGPGDGGAR